jgi:SAM-dependent MidA family methyltransferase
LNVERSALNTQNGNGALIRLIRAEIEKRGPVSFAWFMHQALYHPEHGYYSSGRCAIGRKGDYFTNVSVGPLFGQLLGAQFAEIWERLGKIDDFVIAEQGAHDGQFARDVLESAQARSPEFFAILRYRIVEPFPALQERQSRMLAQFRDKVEWHESLQPFVGVHFSNELLDAMPARMMSGAIEKLVALEGDKFVLIERPLPSQGATASQSSQKQSAFNQPALDWIDDIAAKLQRGYVIAIDYGRLGDEFRAHVQARAQHRNLNSPFEQIGHADITMCVDWTSIAARASLRGLHVAGFTDQHHFLTGIISTRPNLFQATSSNSTALSSRVQVARPDRKTQRALHTLLHPEMLGRAFQVLALARDVDPGAPRLAGFRFAREPCFG